MHSIVHFLQLILFYGYIALYLSLLVIMECLIYFIPKEACDIIALKKAERMDVARAEYLENRTFLNGFWAYFGVNLWLVTAMVFTGIKLGVGAVSWSLFTMGTIYVYSWTFNRGKHIWFGS